MFINFYVKVIIFARICALSQQELHFNEFRKIVSKLNDKMVSPIFIMALHHFCFLIDILICKSAGINEKSIFFADVIINATC